MTGPWNQLIAIALVAMGPAGALGHNAPALFEMPAAPDAFTASSVWNVRHDADAVDRDSDTWIKNIQSAIPPDQKYVVLSDGTDTNYGIPFYTADGTEIPQVINCFDPNCWGFPVPVPAFCANGATNCYLARIPDDAAPETGEGKMVIFDASPDAGTVIFPSGAVEDPHGRWSADGFGVDSINSQGIDRCWAINYPTQYSPTNLVNWGHRGLPGAYAGVRWREVMSAVSSGTPIGHVLQLVIPDTGPSHFFPIAQDEGRAGDVPEGALVRLKATVDLSGLTPGAKAIAQALKVYGAVVANTTGASNPVAQIPLENLVVEGSPHSWADLGVDTDSMSTIPFDVRHFEVADLGLPGGPGNAPWQGPDRDVAGLCGEQKPR
jgi:hypothetical protein